MLLGNPTTSEDGEVIAAEALRFFFLLKNTETVVGGEYVDPIPDAWEEEFIIVTQVRIVGVEGRLSKIESVAIPNVILYW